MYCWRAFLVLAKQRCSELWRARCILNIQRIQFTPDLMPGDIVGSMVIEGDEHGSKMLRFQPGPIFANLVLADEINRATPKTQSALLEAMQEHTVTSGTTTHELELPVPGHAPRRTPSRWRAPTRSRKLSWTAS